MKFFFYNPVVNTGKLHVLLQDENGVYPLIAIDASGSRIGCFDINGFFVDSGINLEEFKKMASFLSDVDELIIVNSREQCEYSNILFDYARTTLKAYIHLFHESGIQNVKVVRVN